VALDCLAEWASRMLGVLGLKWAAKRLVNAYVRWGVPRTEPKVLRTIPHEETAFTQGLAYRKGALYESTLGDEISYLRRVDPLSGLVQLVVSVKQDYAEGIAFMGDCLFQLSWQSGRARVYRYPDLLLLGSRGYRGEGWGLTSDGSHLIMSNGTSLLQFVDEEFVIHRRLGVTSNGMPVRNLNDLEYVNGLLYANVLGSNEVLEICAETGKLRRIIDCSHLWKIAAGGGPADVMNGIAYAPDRDTFFMTGKRWRYLFEVTFPAGREDQ
jgi:glutamine cyclotransferase